MYECKTVPGEPQRSEDPHPSKDSGFQRQLLLALRAGDSFQRNQRPSRDGWKSSDRSGLEFLKGLIQSACLGGGGNGLLKWLYDRPAERQNPTERHFVSFHSPRPSLPWPELCYYGTHTARLPGFTAILPPLTKASAPRTLSSHASPGCGNQSKAENEVWTLQGYGGETLLSEPGLPKATSRGGGKILSVVLGGSVS